MTVWSNPDPKKKDEEDVELVDRWMIVLDNVQKAKDSFKLYGSLWWIDKAFFTIFFGIAVICLNNQSMITEKMTIVMNCVVILGLLINLILSFVYTVQTWCSDKMPKNLETLKINGKLSNENMNLVKTRVKDLSKGIWSPCFKFSSNYIIVMIQMVSIYPLNHDFLIFSNRKPGHFDDVSVLTGVLLSFLSFIMNILVAFSCSYPDKLWKMKELISTEEDEKKELVDRWIEVLEKVQKTTDIFKPFVKLWWVDKALLAVFILIAVICLFNQSFITGPMTIFMNSVAILSFLIQLLASLVLLVRLWSSDNTPKKPDSLKIDGKLSNANFNMVKTREKDLSKSYDSTLFKMYLNALISVILMLPILFLNCHFSEISKREMGSFDLSGALLAGVSSVINLIILLSLFLTVSITLGDMWKSIDSENKRKKEQLA